MDWVFTFGLQRIEHDTTIVFIWVNYNISLTWILRPFGDDSPNPNHDSQGSVAVRSWSNLPRFMELINQGSRHWASPSTLCFTASTRIFFSPSGRLLSLLGKDARAYWKMVYQCVSCVSYPFDYPYHEFTMMIWLICVNKKGAKQLRLSMIPWGYVLGL